MGNAAMSYGGGWAVALFFQFPFMGIEKALLTKKRSDIINMGESIRNDFNDKDVSKKSETNNEEPDGEYFADISNEMNYTIDWDGQENSGAETDSKVYFS